MFTSETLDALDADAVGMNEAVYVSPIQLIDLHLTEMCDRQTVLTSEVRDWLLDLRLLLNARETENQVLAGTLS